MNKLFKLIIAALSIIGAVYLFFNKEIGWGICSLLLAGLSILLYYKNEYLLISLYYMNKQDIPKVESWLNKITNPKAQLIQSQEAYFYYMQGMLKGQKQDKNALKESEILMKKALDLGLNEKHDLAGAKLNLAIAAMSKGKKREAELLLAEAKKLDTSGLLTEQIKSMKQQLKMINVNMNSLQNPMYRNRGKFK